jgi:hypothetical protein
MGVEFNPYPKSEQLKGHQKPKVKKKRYPPARKKKKPQVTKGRVIPTKRTRGRVTTAEYNESLRQHGETCWVCNSPHIEMHHVFPKKYSGESGRGVWRNLRALCPEHHRGENGVHGKNGHELMVLLQEEHKRLYGEFYYMDRFDLFVLGMIPNATKEAYETFMKMEEEHAKGDSSQEAES